ncbi:MAG TPA: hypothetical protein VFX50_19185 [Gemmatimonadales bacterium]|nr:hypothetical protein [Gemmatimonadales bacterium]
MPGPLTLVLTALVGVYLAIGACFAAAFALRGAGIVEPAARDATWGFRLLVLPGALTLWPLLLSRWMRVAR